MFVSLLDSGTKDKAVSVSSWVGTGARRGVRDTPWRHTGGPAPGNGVTWGLGSCGVAEREERTQGRLGGGEAGSWRSDGGQTRSASGTGKGSAPDISAPGPFWGAHPRCRRGWDVSWRRRRAVRPAGASPVPGGAGGAGLRRCFTRAVPAASTDVPPDLGGGRTEVFVTERRKGD